MFLPLCLSGMGLSVEWTTWSKNVNYSKFNNQHDCLVVVMGGGRVLCKSLYVLMLVPFHSWTHAFNNSMHLTQPITICVRFTKTCRERPWAKSHYIISVCRAKQMKIESQTLSSWEYNKVFLMLTLPYKKSGGGLSKPSFIACPTRMGGPSWLCIYRLIMDWGRRVPSYTVF